MAVRVRGAAEHKMIAPLVPCDKSRTDCDALVWIGWQTGTNPNATAML